MLIVYQLGLFIWNLPLKNHLYRNQSDNESSCVQCSQKKGPCFSSAIESAVPTLRHYASFFSPHGQSLAVVSIQPILM